MPKRKKKTAKKINRRTLLKGAGAAVATITAGLFIPRMVHSEVLKTANHPTWDRLLGRIGRQTVGLHASDRTPELNRWIHGMAMRPQEPQPALILTGPDCSGKTTFHRALGLLLPPGKRFVSYGSPRTIWPSDENLKWWGAWLFVIDGENPGRYRKLFANPDKRDGRFVKWCLTHNQSAENLPNSIHFKVNMLATTMPRMDLLRRLEDERDAFRQTLFRQRLAA
jgi:hypothetical protein